MSTAPSSSRSRSSRGGEGLESFLPLRLSRRLLSFGSGPSEARFEGALLVIGVAGFGELVERAASGPPFGLETLGGLLDAHIGAAIRAVQDTGGEVVHILGDSLIAYFAADELGGISHAVVHGFRAARRAIDAPGAHSELALSAGLAAGGLWAARVGSVQHGFQLVFGGDAVRDALGVQTSGERFQIATSDSAARMLEANADPDELTPALEPSTVPERERHAPASAQISGDVPIASIPRVVRERLNAGGWLSELRDVTALSLCIEGLDDRSPDALALFQRTWAHVLDALAPFTFESGKLLIEPCGVVLHSTFGIPHNTHSDDFLRAVRAALVVERRLEREGMRCAAGIARGRAYCGILGDQTRREYSSIGAPMQRAKRLMLAAEQGVLSADPFDDTLEQPDLSCERVGELSLTGGSSELFALRVRAVDTIEEPVVRLQGRARETARIEGLLGQLRGGRGLLVGILGQPGVGKSALLRELGDRAERHGIFSVSGQCDPESGTAFAAFRRVLLALLDLSSDASEAAVEARLLEELSRGRREDLLPLLCPLFRIPARETSRTLALHGAARSGVTLELLSELFSELIAVPSVVLIEDVHWMDSASWRLLERVAELVPGVLFAVTARSEEAKTLVGLLDRFDRAARLELEPLDEPSSLALARELWGRHTLPPTVYEMVRGRSHGNPLFIVECVLLASKSQRPSFGPGGGEGTDLISVRALVLRRFDQLAPSHLLAVKAASVLGRAFSWRLLEALVETTTAARMDPEARAVLLRERIFVPVGSSREVFSFSHDLIREVAYESMLKKQCRVLHEQAASALVDQRIFEAPAGILAHHFLLAEDPLKAVLWSERAGNEALDAGAFEEAVTYFKRCLELSTNDGGSLALEERVRFHRKLCDAFSGLGDPDARSRFARKGLVFAGEPEPKPAPTPVSRAAGALLQRSLPDFRGKNPGGLDLELSRLYRHLAHVAYFESDGPGLFVASLRSVRMAERAPASAVLCGSLAELGGAVGLGGLHALGMRYLDRAIHVAERIEHPHGLSHALMVRALYLAGRGEWDQADLSARRSGEISDSLDDSVNFGNAKIIRFWIAYHLGEFTRAEGIGRALLTRAERTGNRQQKTWARRGLGMLRLRAETYDAALAELELARNDSSASDANEWMPVLGGLALCRLGLGEAGRALELLRSALEVSEKLGRPTGQAILTGLTSMAEVALTLQRAAPEHRPLVERSLSRLDAYRRVFPIGEPAFHRLQGVWARDLGEARRARRFFARAFEAAERLCMKQEQLLLARDAQGGP